MQFVLEEPSTPVRLGIAGRKISHLTDEPEEPTVRFLCGYVANDCMLVLPEDKHKPCRKCDSAAAGDARVKRLYR